MGTWQKVFMPCLLALPQSTFVISPVSAPAGCYAPHGSSVQAAARFTSSPAAVNNDAFVMCCLMSTEHESQ